MTTALHHLLNWQLLSGSHEWPGPHGGTCINEAAIVVAGLPYRSVSSVDDLPPCFSRVIGCYLLTLNDQMDDASRQRLIEFAPRLSGSADTPAVEQKRLEYIIIETVRRIVASAMDAAGLPDQAEACRAAMTLDEAKQAADKAGGAATAVDWVTARDAANVAKAAYAAKVANSAYAARAFDAAYVSRAGQFAAELATGHHGDQRSLCFEIVRGALAIGNQAAPIEVAIITSRAAEFTAGNTR